MKNKEEEEENIETFTFTNYANVIFKLKASFHLSVTYILSLNFNLFYIMYNPVIVIGTNYFVLWNDFHSTV